MVTGDEIYGQLEQAAARLAESLALDKNDIHRDSSILRFVLVAELAWKTIKRHLEDTLKVRCASPKACFREAYNQKLIAYEQRWLDMIDDRNAIAHLYKEEWADAIYGRLPEYLNLLQQLLKNLRSDK